MSHSPFEFSQYRIQPGLLEIEVKGFLDADGSRRYLASLTTAIRRERRRVGLLFRDNLDGFSVGGAARAHAEWFNSLGQELTGVAIVSAKTSIRFAVVTAKLLTKVPIEVFQDEVAARRWLDARQDKTT